ncbi:hypothetical protein F2P81_005178 [Scophthalmus maximus]|uniref:Uncharacterized protein n=1 Tax=Scophthalmus maximus TaxID=52904 RepID=A0A6A4T2F3_SCOMX|nr:hypothetical protein F2P81_005178 [Scophthalmus maximus]
MSRGEIRVRVQRRHIGDKGIESESTHSYSVCVVTEVCKYKDLISKILKNNGRRNLKENQVDAVRVVRWENVSSFLSASFSGKTEVKRSSQLMVISRTGGPTCPAATPEPRLRNRTQNENTGVSPAAAAARNNKSAVTEKPYGERSGSGSGSDTRVVKKDVAQAPRL